MKIVISSGHAKNVRGASASPQPPYLDEVNEARKIVEEVAKDLRAGGVTVTTYHDNESTTQSQNLSRIVAFHNGQGPHDLDISVHLNASQKTSQPMGTEVLWKTQKELASKVSAALASALQLPDRGQKKRDNLAFLNGTREKSILIEYCFVDSSADGDHHRAHFPAACQAIANVVGELDATQPPEPVEPPTTEASRVDITVAVQGNAAVYVNGQLISATPPAPVAEFAPNHTDVIATWFQDDTTAYDPFDAITDTELSVSLPAHVGDAEQRSRGVRVRNRANGKTAIGKVRDKGPWLVDDDAYVFQTVRSLAETCHKTGTPLPRGPHKGKVPNGAGIDLSPGLKRAIAMEGTGRVDWDFVSDAVA